MDFFKSMFRKKDPFEVELRSAVNKLHSYEAVLQRELKKWAALPFQRAAEIDKTRDECRRKLILLYNWALTDLVDTYYKQAVLLMKRVWLRSILDTAAVQALQEQVHASQLWRYGSGTPLTPDASVL
jgi:hypothetical protein